MTEDKRSRWAFLEQDTDAWKLGSGFTVETALAALYDRIIQQGIKPAEQRLLDKLK